MKHRTLQEIFPPYYPSVPDSEEIMRRCVAHFHSAEVPEDLIRWIQQMPCPYLREAYVEGMRAAILHGVEQGDDSFRMNANVREEVQHALIVSPNFGRHIYNNYPQKWPIFHKKTFFSVKYLCNLKKDSTFAANFNF